MDTHHSEFIQLFANSAIHTLKVQCKFDAQLASTFLKGQGEQKPFEVGGIIGISSPFFKGTVTLGFSKAIFTQILQGLLGETVTDITTENEDAAAELLNIIFSHAKTMANKKGTSIQMAIPSVIRGSSVEAGFSTNQEVHVLAFKTAFGEFYAQIQLKMLEKTEQEDIAKQGKESALTPAQKAAFFLPFLKGIITTLEVQIGIKVKSGKPTDKSPTIHYPFDIAGVAGITSKTVSGSFLIVFKQDVFLKLASKMFGEEYKELQPGLDDLVAELVNMALGVAKRVLNEQGHGVQMVIPTVIRGSNIHAGISKTRKVIVIPFESDIGQFHVEIDIDS